MSDKMDCQSKISAFIGSVNKLIVVSTLFKSYCCSYYSCQIWKLDSLAFRGGGVYVHLGIKMYALFYICLILFIRIYIYIYMVTRPNKAVIKPLT